MRTLKLLDGDLCFDESELQMVEGNEEIAQSVLISLKTRLGEFKLDENVGLDRANVLGKALNIEEARYDIVEAIMQEERITSVDQLEIHDDRTTRTRKVDLKMSINETESLELGEVDLA